MFNPKFAIANFAQRAALILRIEPAQQTNRCSYSNHMFINKICSKIRAGFSNFIRNPADKKTKVRETQPFDKRDVHRANFPCLIKRQGKFGFKNIIVNLPNNIGDTILALSALDKLHSNYPQANLTLICSKQTQELFLHHPHINKTLLFDKRWKARQKLNFSITLRGRYDLIVDFKNSFLPLFTGGKHTPIFRKFINGMHAKDKYLYLIRNIAPSDAKMPAQFFLTEDEEKKWKSLQITQSIFIACASNALQKRYPYNRLKTLVTTLTKRFPVVILGQELDRQFYKDILDIEGVNDLVGKTKIHEVFYLLKNYARLLVCVDSSIMHIASYLDIPIVAMFGQTSVHEYGPWSKKYIVVKRDDLNCAPCNNPHCKFNHECMEIEPQLVLDAID